MMGGITKLKFLGGVSAFGSILVLMAGTVVADDRWYVSGNAGATLSPDITQTDTFAAGSVTGDADLDTGFGLSAAVGRSFGNIRVEGEISYRDNDLAEWNNISGNLTGNLFTATGPLAVDANSTSIGFMANGHYDFKTSGKWTPFVMGGLGVSRVNLDVKSVAGTAVTYDESDTVVAYQVGAGVGYALSADTSVDLSYRFFATADPTFDDGTDKVDSEYSSHNIWVGLTHKF